MPAKVISLGICKISKKEILLVGGATGANEKSSNNVWVFNTDNKEFGFKRSLHFKYAATYGCELGYHNGKVYLPVDGNILEYKYYN